MTTLIFDNEELFVACERCAGPLAINASIEGPHWACSKCGWSGESDSPLTGEDLPRDFGMPDSDYQVREVLAHYGAAVSTANVLETGLINFLTLVQNKSKKNPTQQSWDHHYAENVKLTLGQLVQRIQQHVILNGELKQELQWAVKARNDLAHYYFRERALHMATFASRAFMIQELRGVQSTLERIDQNLTAERKQLLGY